MDMNKATLIGHLAADPTVLQKTTHFTLATAGVQYAHAADSVRHRTTTEHHIEANGKLGQIVAKYLHKGDRLFLEGRLQGRTVLADQLIMLGKVKR